MDMVSCGFLVFLVQPQIAVHNDSYTQQPHYYLQLLPQVSYSLSFELELVQRSSSAAWLLAGHMHGSPRHAAPSPSQAACHAHLPWELSRSAHRAVISLRLPDVFRS